MRAYLSKCVHGGGRHRERGAASVGQSGGASWPSYGEPAGAPIIGHAAGPAATLSHSCATFADAIFPSATTSLSWPALTACISRRSWPRHCRVAAPPIFGALVLLQSQLIAAAASVCSGAASKVR